MRINKKADKSPEKIFSGSSKQIYFEDFALALQAFLYSGNCEFPDCYFCKLKIIEQK